MRSKNMQSLTNDIHGEYPGVVIYGKGDRAHELRISDHNEDDTQGVRAAQSDADTIPEHRAIDVMLGPAMSIAQMLAIINYILSQPQLLKRLKYINFLNWQWSKSSGWVRHDNSDDPHPGHAHFSADQADDNNTAPWLNGGSDMRASYGDKSDDVTRLQEKMRYVLGDDPRLVTEHPLVIDGDFGGRTDYWVSALLTGGERTTVTPAWFDRLNDMVRAKEITMALEVHKLTTNHGGQLPETLTFVIPEQTVTAELT